MTRTRRTLLLTLVLIGFFVGWAILLHRHANMPSGLGTLLFLSAVALFKAMNFYDRPDQP